MFPLTTGPAEPVLVMSNTAAPCTVTGFSTGNGEVLVPLIQAVLVIVLPKGALGSTLNWTLVDHGTPTATVPTFQVITPVASGPVLGIGLALTKVMLTGTVSVTTTPGSFSVPLLTTLTV